MNSLFLRGSLLVLFLSGLTFTQVHATHLRAGEITVERVSCTALTFRITITVFTNTIGTNVLFGGTEDILDFGDGSDPDRDGRPGILVPTTENTLRPDLGEGIATASFTVLHTYSSARTYLISYLEPNRNEGVLNMDFSINTRFYIETEISIDPFVGCNNSPRLLVPPIDVACPGAAFFHNPGAFDPDGDSLSYELVVPFRNRSTPVTNYKDPNDSKFYTNFETGNEAGTGRPTFAINAVDGTITWDAPGAALGEYNIAFIIKEWRKIGDEWVSIGFVRRDMQILVEDCDNDRPDLEVPEDLCVVAGTLITENIIGKDVNGDPVKIEAFSEIFNFPAALSPATYSPVPGVNDFRPQPATTTFRWQTECIHVKAQPYQVVFKVTDRSPSGSRLVTFKTWNIRVVGPPPVWDNAVLNPATRRVNLQWDPYVCQNADSIQVWRKVDSTPFTPDECETGLPESLGYVKIATLPRGNGATPTTSFLDTNFGRGLDPGAQYCYRLVALFPQPKGGESIVSDEICVDPIEVDEPVITNVSIERTDPASGRILVRWTKPFELNRTQFPGPLEYEVYRAEGFSGDVNLVKVSGPGRKLENDTTLIDEGMNTQDVIFNYRIVLYSNTNLTPTVYSPVDTSSIASSVRLEAQSQENQITLTWSADVPWTLSSQYAHEIYRGGPGSDISTMTLLATVDPLSAGLTYEDPGLDETQTYCYVVKTRGAYGNPAIREPLENWSQIVCAQPSDDEAPCKPTLFVQLSDCEDFRQTQACGQGIFKNTLFWERPVGDCARDVAGYKVYRASSKDGEYTWLTNAGRDGVVRDTFFVDNGINNTGLSTLAYCYKIVAVDRSGNESEFSEPACNDNCPYYELPNVFTPNGDDCNDKFSAYSDRPSGVEGGPGNTCVDPPDEIIKQKCARFVQKVVFRVYNRWGKEVYNYESGSERTIYIDWDGKDNNGQLLPSGVYYYVAEVTFDTVDPGKRNQILKSWVHLIR